ncbi:MAG: aspartate carbamoyltransferase catalytic subunit [Clostridiales bacterium]|jgi:aspartate carbamoyltransferase catalytic subunit|nr:aspartate carbamoyltransferase catalytic subunit [Clostridiales bacterium]
MKGLLTLKSLSIDQIKQIINLAIDFKNGLKVDFTGKKMVTLFYENSTRTQYSFQMAMLNLGITPLSFNLAGSSVYKGETLYDTVRTFESLGVDGVVIRHTQDVYYKELDPIQIPIFNGGDGTSDHPTQTLLDLMTIYEEFGRYEGIKVALVGDIAHSRVAHGNAEVMKRLGMEIFVSGPEQYNDHTCPYIDLDDAVKTCDVINLLRVQFERHKEDMNITKEEYLQKYGMTTERVSRMKKNSIIMHPAPVNRGIEIESDVVECERSRIYKQMTNGVFVRMAAITMALRGELRY